MNNTYHIASSCQQFGFQICSPTSEILGREFWYPAEDLGLDFTTSLQIQPEILGQISRSSAQSLNPQPRVSDVGPHI